VSAIAVQWVVVRVLGTTNDLGQAEVEPMTEWLDRSRVEDRLASLLAAGYRNLRIVPSSGTTALPNRGNRHELRPSLQPR